MRGGQFDKEINQKSKKREWMWPLVQLAMKQKEGNEAWEGRNDAANKQPKGKTLDMNPTGKKVCKVQGKKEERRKRKLICHRAALSG